MRISELSERSGVPVATLKFYLREGMLPRGRPTAKTQAEYGEEHLARLRVIGALSGVPGLPLARIRVILGLLDDPGDDPLENMGEAVNQLPPYVDAEQEHPRARATIEHLGLSHRPAFAAVAQLESAIAAIEAAGMVWDTAAMDRYGKPMMDVAKAEIEPVLDGTLDLDPTTYAVLGTALHEPVLLALRRLAHLHVLLTGADELNGADDPNPGG